MRRATFFMRVIEYKEKLCLALAAMSVISIVL